MTTTSIPFDELHLIEDGDFRTDPISVEASIIYADANRWSITDVKVYAWSSAPPITMKAVKPSPEIEAAIRHKIMTNKGWCEFISRTIASEIAQANRQPSQHAELVMG
jgi:hypothetical protein